MIALLANHLWQSTLCALAAGLLTLAFRAQRADVRYGLWLAASAKFLVPFAALAALGARAGWHASTPAGPSAVTFAMDALSQPFSSLVDLTGGSTPAGSSWPRSTSIATIVVLSIWLTGSLLMLVTWWIRWRRVARAARQSAPIEHGDVHDALRRLEAATAVATPIAVVSSRMSLEPGVFGIRRAVLLWPQPIAEHLSAAQIEAILAHEVAHVRRRDNLTAALHMLVEAAFWFHPLVWWLGARLVDERERACDEAVVRLGTDPGVYAESILKTCELCVESPLVCVAGVTGSDLRQRIERIMTNDAPVDMNGWRKLLLTAAAAIVIVGPVAAGALTPGKVVSAFGRTAQTSPADQGPQTSIAYVGFKVVSVTANVSDDTRSYPFSMTNGRFVARNVRLGNLIGNMYRLSGVRMQGGPAWLNTDRFDIEAEADGNPSPGEMMPMVRKLLADKFGLIVHVDTQQQPVYILGLVRRDGVLGPRLRPSVCTERGPAPPGPLESSNPPPLPCGGFRTRPGTLTALWQTMSETASGLSLIFGRQVSDGTGLSGKYDMDASWTPDTRPPGPQAYGVGPTTLTALEEQLGLKLEERTGPVQILVIDRAEKPVTP